MVGVDVSSTSIEHTEALKRQYNLTNLELRQISLESVQDLFDICLPSLFFNVQNLTFDSLGFNFGFSYCLQTFEVSFSICMHVYQ